MEKSTLSPEHARRMRLTNNRLLHPPETSPRDLLDHLAAVQAQEIAAGRLQMHVRAPNITLQQIEHARQVERSILWGSFFRGTLHLIPAPDALWIIPLLKPSHLARDAVRMRQLGWDEANTPRGVDALLKAMKTHNRLTYTQVREVLHGQGLPSRDQAHVHLLYYMSYHGLICRGPDDGRQLTYTLLEDWIGPLQPLPKGEALARLAQRYLAAYAPATMKDFMAWCGLPAPDARAGWNAVMEQTVEVVIGDKPYRILKTHADLALPTLTDPTVHLLPRFDQYILGYHERGLIMPDAYRRLYNAGGGIANALVLVNGCVKSAWYFDRSRKNTRLVVEPFEELPSTAWEEIEHLVRGMERFLDERLEPVFPHTPGWSGLIRKPGKKSLIFFQQLVARFDLTSARFSL